MRLRRMLTVAVVFFAILGGVEAGSVGVASAAGRPCNLADLGGPDQLVPDGTVVYIGGGHHGRCLDGNWQII